MPFEQAITSSYWLADRESLRPSSYSGYRAMTIDGVLSPRLRGSLCHSSSVRNGINGCNIVRPPSKAAYRVSMVLLLASSDPSLKIDLEFS